MKVFNDLLPYSRFRPTTPVGQLMWNEQISAVQAALYGSLTPRQALEEANANCQRALDRLGELTADDAPQHTRVVQLRRLVAERLALLAEGIQLRQDFGLEEARRFVRVSQ